MCNSKEPRKTQTESRKLTTEQRQHQKHLQESMPSRSAEELEKLPANKIIQEDSRELTAEQRQHLKQRQQSMLNRSEAEVGMTGAENSTQA